MESTFVFGSQFSSFVLLPSPSDMPMASTLEKQCFLCNVKEIDGNCLVHSQESSLILCEVLNVPHLMNNIKKLESINYCHPCMKRILKIHESLDILKKLEKEVLEEKYLLRLQLETNFKDVSNEMYYSSCDFGLELMDEMRFKSIKSKLKKVFENQIDRKCRSKTRNYRIMKNITITEKLNHGTFMKHVSKETTPMISNIISIEKQQFINDNISVPSNDHIVESATNLPFHHADFLLTSHVYDFEDIKLDLLSGETNNSIDIKDPFEGIAPESGFVTQNSKTQKTFICGICETNFHDYIQLDEHCRTHHTVEKRFKCSYCEKTFSKPHGVKSHESIHTGEKPFKCSYCQKSFSLLHNVKTHERIHTGEKPFKCSYCEKTFSRPDGVKSHERIHTEEKPFKCSYCQKSFSLLHNVKTHERIHTGEKPFNCSYCEKQFSQLIQAKSHESIHTGEKPFMCSYCEKTFSRADIVKSHERIHTGEKPFKCGYCDKTFGNPSNRRKHEATHRSAKPFKCKFCEKFFSQKSNMKIHEHIHTGEKRFKCGYCDKTFGNPSNRRTHEATHRSETFQVQIL